MSYELWDVESGNIIKTYASEDEALVVVRNLVALNGPKYARALVLTFEDDNEDTSLVAKGMALSEHAQAATPRSA